MRRLTGILMILCALALTSVSSAASPEWSFDPNHCEVVFKIKHIFAYVTGVFEEFDGKVLFDPSDLDGSAIQVRVAVNSINTRIEKRDQHLRSEAFFETEKYPYMTFASSEIFHENGNNYIARGKLTIKDVTQEIELPFTYSGTRQNPFDNGQLVLGVDAEYTLDRLIYRVGSGKYYQQGLVDKDVILSIHLELVRNQ